MAKFPNITITQEGLNAIAKATNEKIIYTHICLGDGVLNKDDKILNFTELKSKKLTADIADISNDSNSQITLQTIVSNKIVEKGFYAREIGIYAKLGENGKEFLYGYANAGNNADYMPDNTQPIDELKLKITLLVGNVENVTAVINSSIIFITLEDCRREIKKHNDDITAHGNTFARKKDVYTKSETDNLLKGKANTSHGNHVPKTETANNTRFLRNDNVWADVTANNIGAPTKTGAGASGTWNINITGNSASAAHANNADVANTLEVTDGIGTKSNGVFYWIGKDGQPQWLWGSNDEINNYVYNPSNFHVAAANNDGNGANIANTYLKRSGGTMTGPLNFANSTWNLVGDDSYVGDHDIAGTFCVKGANGETGIALFKPGSDSDYAHISYDGGYINFNKKIAADLAGNADTATNVAWSGVTGKPNLALKDGDTIYTNDWFRSRGATGWYNESYGGGWYMTDSTWIRAFNNKSVYTPAKMQADGGFYGNLKGNADTANVGKALQVFDGNNNAINSTFHWIGKDGQPQWLWGSNDGSNAYVYNPANFRVSYATNANSAVNADTVDGYHASDLLRTLGGNRTPVMTDIFDRAGTIDLTAISAADKARHKALINKSQNTIQNLWNNTTGIHAYGGDVDMANGYAHGTLKLTQSYKNFDKILVVATTDVADWITYRIWDTWELAHAFSSCFAFDLLAVQGRFWIFYGTQQHGTGKFVWSTDTVWSCRDQNCGIVAIYGIKY